MTVRSYLTVVLLAALAVPAGAQSDVEVVLSPSLPIVGLPLEVEAQFLDSVPESASLFIRAVGEVDYQELVAVDQGGGVWAVTLDEVPPSGIEVYASYVLDGVTFTEPVQGAQDFPFRIPAFVPVLTSGVSLPARQYRMVSVPMSLGSVPGLGRQLGSDAPIDVFGDDFGEDGDPALWRLLRWDPLDDLPDYRDAIEDGERFERIRPGAGYWLITSSGGTFDVEGGLSTGVVFDGGPFPSEVSIPVFSGWNQIGNPYLFPIQWDDVGRPLAVEDPVAFTGSYQGGQTTLQPWQGYFVFNPGLPGTLRFSATADASTPERTLAERVRERAGAGAAALRVTAIAGEARDEVTVGVRGVPTLAEGPPADLRKPPPVDGGLRVAIRAEGQDWISRFHAPDQAAWTLTVTPPVGGADLRLEPLGDWPEGLVVEDLDTGRTLPVVAGRVRVVSLPDVPVRRMTVRAGAALVAAPVPSAPYLGAPRPNPSAGSVTLSVASPSPARLDVVDVLGRTVRSQGVSAGASEVTWDGLDGEGQPVAAGLYLVRLSTETGTAAVRVTRLR